MITGVHALVYTKDPDGARKLFRDVLKFDALDIGRGWLIFRLPPAEMACHPAEDSNAGTQELWLMCDDITRTLADLTAANVPVKGPAIDRGWGLVSGFVLPGGETMHLYQPKHATNLAPQ